MNPTRTALIVEDDNLFAALVKHMLIQNGYDVIATFKKGEEAIEFLKDHSVSLITMDIDLEGQLNGLETTEKLRGIVSTPVLFLSARKRGEVEQKTKKLSPSLFMNKFLNKQQFSEAVSSLQTVEAA